MHRTTWIGVVLLIGIGLGLLLPRLWVAGLPAEAANKATWRCVFGVVTSPEVVIHNPTGANVTMDVDWIDQDGTITAEFEQTVLAGGTESIGGAPVVKLRGSSKVLIDAHIDDYQVACFKQK